METTASTLASLRMLSLGSLMKRHELHPQEMSMHELQPPERLSAVTAYHSSRLMYIYVYIYVYISLSLSIYT